MDWSNGCLNVSASDVLELVLHNVKAKSINEHLKILCSLIDYTKPKLPLKLFAYRINNGLKIGCKNLNHTFMHNVFAYGIQKGITVKCSPICSIDKNFYLFTSTDTLWLTTDTLSGEFDIISNVIWKID